MIERFFLGLHATVPATLVIVTLVQLFPPERLTSPALRPAWVVWLTVGIWLASSLLLALSRRRIVLWKIALHSTGALLLAAACAGMATGAPIATSMLISLAIIGTLCVAAAAAIGEHRVKRHQQAARSTGLERRQAGPGSRLSQVMRGLPFGIAGALLVEAFRLAHLGQDALRGAGMVGMVIAFFLLLPGATLATWLPRTAALLFGAASLLWALVALKAQLPQWWLAALLCGALAVGVGLRRRRA
ncbi:hypothetical protein B0920_00740 [Massilia sp. KIM]|uniref:hypothetical protein n=1 Tax=Massilia sp. KIM TaxID=1955422 RepID=UPI00098FA813|nr:hypothetical protein [Massilia sp. KIM]OON62055.1 hypothetical protein B0920_00740 [Massilia sp. KIM]